MISYIAVCGANVAGFCGALLLNIDPTSNITNVIIVTGTDNPFIVSPTEPGIYVVQLTYTNGFAQVVVNSTEIDVRAVLADMEVEFTKYGPDNTTMPAHVLNHTDCGQILSYTWTTYMTVSVRQGCSAIYNDKIVFYSS